MRIADRFRNSTYKILMKNLNKNKEGFVLRFYIANDPEEKELSMGCEPNSSTPYYLEFADGEIVRFNNSDELINSKQLNGKSLVDRWDTVRILTVNGMTFDDWKESR